MRVWVWCLMGWWVAWKHAVGWVLWAVGWSGSRLVGLGGVGGLGWRLRVWWMVVGCLVPVFDRVLGFVWGAGFGMAGAYWPVVAVGVRGFAC